MMLALILNVINNAGHIRFAHRESAISILPPKIPQISEGFMHPFRGLALEVFGNFKRSQRRWSEDQSMNVILYTANLNGSHLVMARDPADVSPNTLLDLWPDESGSILRAEDDVIEQGRIGIGHALLLA